MKAEGKSSDPLSPSLGRFRKIRVSGIDLSADLETKLITIEDWGSRDLPTITRLALLVFSGDDLLRVLEFILRVHQNFWHGTY